MKLYYDWAKVSDDWMDPTEKLKFLERLAGKDLWVICKLLDDGDGGPAGTTAIRVLKADWFRIYANWCELYGNLDLPNLAKYKYPFKLNSILIPKDVEIMTTEEFLEFVKHPFYED